MINTNVDDRILQCEYGLVGCILISFNAVKRYQSVLSSSDFKDINCEAMWLAFCESENREEYVDNAHKRKVSVIDLGASMDTLYAKEALLPMVVEKIKQAAQARRIRKELLDVLQEDDMDIAARLERLAANAKGETLADFDQLPQQQADDVIASLQQDNTADRIKTGWPTFDNYTQGLRLGNVSVIGAFPSTGKTALALSIMGQAAKDNKRSLFFSQEMTCSQLYERYISNFADISYWGINKRNLDSEKVNKAARFAIQTANEKNVWLFDSCRYIEQQAARIIQLKPSLVIVDFLQQVRSKERHNSNAEKLEFLVDEYKRLAAANNCHILVLSQQNRAASQDQGKASMFNLKGSSAIESGGDYIAILDRPNVYDPKQPAVKAELKLTKNKFGSLGNVRLWFDGDNQRFRELARGETFPPPSDPDEEKPFAF